MQIYKQTQWLPKQFLSATRKTFLGEAPAHGHDFFEMELILDGNGTYTINGVTYPIEKNTLFLMTPAHVHTVSSTGMDLFNVMFQYDYRSTSFALPVWDFRRPPIIHLTDKEAAFLTQLLTEIVDMHEVNLSYAMRLLRCVLQKLSLCEDRANEPNLPYINNAMLYILENFRTNLTLEQMATHLGLSSSYFSNLFQRQTGMRFKEYLDSLRLSYACTLLAFSAISIRGVCTQAGFQDYANFARRFKQRYKMTPREYRRQHYSKE